MKETSGVGPVKFPMFFCENKRVELKVFNHDPDCNCGAAEICLDDYYGWNINTVARNL